MLTKILLSLTMYQYYLTNNFQVFQKNIFELDPMPAIRRFKNPKYSEDDGFLQFFCWLAEIGRGGKSLTWLCTLVSLTFHTCRHQCSEVEGIRVNGLFQGILQAQNSKFPLKIPTERAAILSIRFLIFNAFVCVLFNCLFCFSELEQRYLSESKQYLKLKVKNLKKKWNLMEEEEERNLFWTFLRFKFTTDTKKEGKSLKLLFKKFFNLFRGQ